MAFVSIEVVDKLATRCTDRFNKHYLALEFCVFGSWPGGVCERCDWCQWRQHSRWWQWRCWRGVCGTEWAASWIHISSIKASFPPAHTCGKKKKKKFLPLLYFSFFFNKIEQKCRPQDVVTFRIIIFSIKEWSCLNARAWIPPPSLSVTVVTWLCRLED